MGHPASLRRSSRYVPTGQPRPCPAHSDLIGECNLGATTSHSEPRGRWPTSAKQLNIPPTISAGLSDLPCFSGQVSRLLSKRSDVSLKVFWSSRAAYHSAPALHDLMAGLIRGKTAPLDPGQAIPYPLRLASSHLSWVTSDRLGGPRRCLFCVCI